jgi:hypothetical protein
MKARMAVPKQVKRLVERFRGPVRSVLEVGSEEYHIGSAPGQRPRGVLGCGGCQKPTQWATESLERLESDV